MSKKILIIGCSNGIKLHQHFSNVFDNDYQYVNLSASGFGNHYIAGRLLEYLETETQPDFIYLQFTGLNRIDIPIDKKVKISDYNYVKETFKRKWIASGGRHGSWTNLSKGNVFKRTFAYMYDILSETGNYDLSLKEIFTGIELCKAMKIKYAWTSYYDYCNPPNDMAVQDGKIKKLPKYIDISQHLGNHPLNLAYEMGDIPEDKVHYSEKIHLTFLEKNKERLTL